MGFRKNAVEALDSLAKKSDNKDAWLLLNSALKHKDIKIRRLVALTVGEGNPEAFPVLIDMLNDKKVIDDYFAVNKGITGTIQKSEFNLKLLDNSENVENVLGVTKAISTLGIFATFYGLPEVSLPEVKGTFVKWLNYDLDDHTKDLMIQGLGSMGDKECIDVIKPFLAKDETKISAAIALGKLGDKSVFPFLLECLNKNQEGLDLLDLSDAFTRIGTPAVGDLIKALDNSNPDVKELAINALGQIGDKSAAPYLINMIDENNPKITSDVVLALGALGEKSALVSLVNLYKSKKTDLRREILRAFEGLADPTIQSLLVEAVNNRDIDLQSRCISICALGKIKDKKAITFLENLFKTESGLIKLNAAYALCRGGKPQYESYLRENLQDENLGEPAASMLVHLKGEEAIPIIEVTMKDASDAEKEFMRNYLKRMIRVSKAQTAR